MCNLSRDNAIEWAEPAIFKPWYTRRQQWKAQQAASVSGSSQSNTPALPAATGIIPSRSNSHTFSDTSKATSPSLSGARAIKDGRPPSLCLPSPSKLTFSLPAFKDDPDIEFIDAPVIVKKEPDATAQTSKKQKGNVPGEYFVKEVIEISDDSDVDKKVLAATLTKRKKSKPKPSGKVQITKLTAVDEVILLDGLPPFYETFEHKKVAYLVDTSQKDYNKWTRANGVMKGICRAKHEVRLVYMT